VIKVPFHPRIGDQRIRTPRTVLTPITIPDADEMVEVLAGRELCH
jgi:hypothetical protein